MFLELDLPSLHPVSRLVLVSSSGGGENGLSCRQVTGRVATAGAALWAMGTEVPWIPVSYHSVGGGVWGIVLAQGATLSLIAVKWVCYRDIIAELEEQTPPEDLRAMGLSSSNRVGRVVRIGSAIVVGSLAQVPLGYQAGVVNGSIPLGLLGGGGDAALTIRSVHSEIDWVRGPVLSRVRHWGLEARCWWSGQVNSNLVRARQYRQLDTVRKRMCGEIAATLAECNAGRQDPRRLCAGLDALEEDEEALANWATFALSVDNPYDRLTAHYDSESLLRTIGRTVFDGFGLILTASHLWMMGGLTYSATEDLFGWIPAAIIATLFISLCGVGIVVEGIGLAPRQFYDGAIDFAQGERPRYHRYDIPRYTLMLFAGSEAVSSIGSAIDGVNRTTSGIAHLIQLPVASAGLAALSWWGWHYVINRVLHFSAHHSQDPRTQSLADAVDRLEGVSFMIQQMSPGSFAALLLDLPEVDRIRLTGNTSLNSDVLHGLADHPPGRVSSDLSSEFRSSRICEDDGLFESHGDYHLQVVHYS